MRSLRSSLRSLLKSPGFTCIAVCTLALGIGVNTAMFSVVRAFILQPAPYEHADRLVRIYRSSAQSKTWPHSAPDLDDLRTHSQLFASIAAFQWWTFSLSGPGEPAERLPGIVASAELFTTLGVQPALGRAFTADEQVPGRDQVVLLTDEFWRSRFGADPQIVGRTIRVDGTPQTVIGVLPPSFAYPLFWGRVDAIRPLVYAAEWQRERSTHWLGAIGRLKPGASVSKAQAEADVIAGQLAQQYASTNAGTGFRVVPLHRTALDDTTHNVSWLMLGLAGCVLLIACVNLANLQIARGAARAHEFAVRAALGATRIRLAREHLAEGLLIAGGGGAAGVGLAVWLNDFLSRHYAVGAQVVPIELDWPVLALPSSRRSRPACWRTCCRRCSPRGRT